MRAIGEEKTVSSNMLGWLLLLMVTRGANAFPGDFEKTERLFDKINLEQSIAAVFNKVAYGSTTKRSIPENAYPLTTLATPLLTTYRYSDGRDEWLRVDVKKVDSSVDYDERGRSVNNNNNNEGYGADLEKDHELPTSAPAADILKNNNNRNYNNPNRYNNDRLKPEFETKVEQVTEDVPKATTSYGVLRNVRPTKSIYSKDVPSYVPPSRAFFTPPLPPEYLNPFADKPTLRGTNSDSFVNRRPIPPPSLTPNKDRVPFRPDLPPGKPEAIPSKPNLPYDPHERKKTLNTPSQNVNLDRLGEFYGGSRNQNDTNFEYEKGYIPSITRILSGSNGRHDEISDILLRTVTATPHLKQEPVQNVDQSGSNGSRMQGNRRGTVQAETRDEEKVEEQETERVEDAKAAVEQQPPDKPEGVTSRKEVVRGEEKEIPTTPTMDLLNLPNVKEKQSNVTKVNTDEVWVVCWNVHVYLVVTLYILLAAFSIVKLVCYERDPHMFSKSYFLAVHLLLTIVCVLRIFYLMYDPYNVHRSFGVLAYEILHGFPLSLLATTFAVLVLFLLKRTLNHLKVKTKPVFLVVFGVAHLVLCFALGVVEASGYFDRAGLIVCKPVFVLLAWALGGSYLYLYRIINKVLSKKTQNETCTQNISYASHITIAVALLFILLGFVQLYSLFLIPVDRFAPGKQHWILWGYELSVRVLEISIASLLAVVVSLKMSSHREKQSVGLTTLFPCTASDSSADNIFPNNCTTNPNAVNYSRSEMALETALDRPTLKAAFQQQQQHDSFEKKSTLERTFQPNDVANTFDRFERPKWGSERVEADRIRQMSAEAFERGIGQNSLRNERTRKAYDAARYYVKPRFDPNDEDAGNVYSEPLDDFDRGIEELRRSKNSTGRRSRRPPLVHLGAQTLPSNHQSDSMLVDDQGFVRFRHLQEEERDKPKKLKKLLNTETTATLNDA